MFPELGHDRCSSTSIDPIGSVGPAGSLEVSPTETTTYILTATNASGGSRMSSVTVTVIDQPTASITANPTTIIEGQSSILSWNCTNADSIFIDHGVGAVELSESYEVRPSVTTTYTITATNAYGSATDAVTITVNNLPLVSIGALPEIIAGGQTTTLSWSSFNADSVEIDNGVGVQIPNASGSQVVAPTETTTYTITGTNAFGTRTASVMVTVGIPPTVSLSVSQPTITEGQATTLSWSSTGASNVRIDQGIGNVTATGTLEVSPAVTTEYTILAVSPFGSSQQSVTVMVNRLPMVSISATPGTITPGDPCEISWTSINADTVSVDPEIRTLRQTFRAHKSVYPTATHLTLSRPPMCTVPAPRV